MSDQSIFKKLSSINVNDKTEKKNNLTYLSWAWAWGVAKKEYPSLTYRVENYDGKPYLYDENLGYLVSTTVTIDGESLPMSLPVMDGANKAMKSEPYTYEVKDWDASRQQGKNVMKEKTVLAATMFDINTAIMRCLTKNLALFGLGHYIYAGEDLPQIKESPEMTEYELEQKLKQFNSTVELNAFYKENQSMFANNAKFIAVFAKRKKELK